MALWNASSASFASTWASAWSWKLRSRSGWSKRIAWNWKRHWFEAVFVPTWRWWTSNAASWQEHRPAFMGDTENANPWHMWGKQGGKHPRTGLLKPIMNNRMTIGPSYSILVLAKWRIAKCSTRSWLLHGQFPLLPMQGWKWPVLEMFRIPGTCLSHHTRITAMNVCDSRFDKLWHSAKSSRSFFQNSSCGTVRCKNGVPQSYLSCFQNLYLE